LIPVRVIAARIAAARDAEFDPVTLEHNSRRIARRIEHDPLEVIKVRPGAELCAARAVAASVTSIMPFPLQL